MLNLEELKQFVTFAELGTLSKTAEFLHVSQPTITRTMQSMEEDFGVSLFTRSKNRIEFNDTGRLAVEYSRKIISAADDALKMVRAHDSSKQVLKIKSCTPSPLQVFLPGLISRFPDRPLSSELSLEELVIESVRSNICDIGIILSEINEEGIFCKELMQERLYLCLPKGHELAAENTGELTFEAINGFDCMINSERGLWTQLCYEKLPKTTLIFPKAGSSFEESIKESIFPFFVTDINTYPDEIFKDRISRPVADPEAQLRYYIISKKRDYIM